MLGFLRCLGQNAAIDCWLLPASRSHRVPSILLVFLPSHPSTQLSICFSASLFRWTVFWYITTHFGLYYIERYSLLSDTVLLLCFRQPELHRQRRSIDVDFHGNTTQKRWRAAAVVAVLATLVVHADDNLCQIPYWARHATRVVNDVVYFYWATICTFICIPRFGQCHLLIVRSQWWSCFWCPGPAAAVATAGGCRDSCYTEYDRTIMTVIISALTI